MLIKEATYRSGKWTFWSKTAAFCIAVILVLPQALRAQGIDEVARVYFSQIRQGESPVMPVALTSDNNHRAVLTILRSYEADTVPAVRYRAYEILQRLAESSHVSELKQEAISRIIQACKDPDGGNAGQAIEYLTSFTRTDFSPVAKDSIRRLFTRKPAHFDELIKLAGFLELTDLKETIRPYSKVGNPQSIRWAAIVSLARMNDNEASAEMMRRIRKLSLNDDVIYEVFPGLVYSRHPEAIAYMVEVMKSDEQNCRTADAEREVPIPCGYRIMEQLAPVIEKYPLELDQSGDVKTKDYVAALKKVREWFARNASYKILRDKY